MIEEKENELIKKYMLTYKNEEKKNWFPILIKEKMLFTEQEKKIYEKKIFPKLKKLGFLFCVNEVLVEAQ